MQSFSSVVYLWMNVPGSKGISKAMITQREFWLNSVGPKIKQEGMNGVFEAAKS